MRFTSSIASFGMLLIDSEFKGESSYDHVYNWLSTVNLSDDHMFKVGLKDLVYRAKQL